MGVGWAGCCAPGGECRALGWPSPASRVVNVFRVRGREWNLLCVGGREGGPPTWPWGSWYFILVPPTGLGEVWGEGQRAGMLWLWHILSQTWRRSLNSVTYCVPAYLFVVNI